MITMNRTQATIDRSRTLPTTELTRSGHCPRCAQLTLTLEDSQ
jgi:hypothetical protein